MSDLDEKELLRAALNNALDQRDAAWKETDRLRAENAELISALVKEAIAKDDAQKRLAEAERLLERAINAVPWWDEELGEGAAELANEIEAFLASQEDKP